MPARPKEVGMRPEEDYTTDGKLEHLCFEERLRGLRVFSPKNRGLRGDLRASFEYLREPIRKMGAVFGKARCDRTKSDGF